MGLTLTPALAVVVVLLAVAGAAVAWLGELGHARAVLTASLRATVQLGAVSLVIAWVLGAPPGVAAFLLVMYGVATVTAGRRITKDRPWPAALPIAAGTLPVLLALFGSGVAPMRGVTLIPIAGILLGGCLTATALAGRRAVDELRQRRGEVEAALALGLLDRDANLEICRPAAAQALVPALDQTRTVGLVTLPGAFVGMLLGGASPLQAGVVQLVVLVGLLAAEAIAVLVTVELVARGRFGRTGTPAS
ncbi:ABC transporter permease [Nonomuraea africana]|uniref:ABC transport system permease protein n=1 Tax=Nonomuraea africana TaxID=46171 RepID=A0ABR9KU06_9ACTN|nr:ABC transporter permease [Nonomuraea africana]MBE1565505.1 putative ABC transport system permease protein [Nonomuraea africana]